MLGHCKRLLSSWCCSVAKPCLTPLQPHGLQRTTIFQSLLKLGFIELVMLSNHLLLCHPLFLLPSIFPSIRIVVFIIPFNTIWFLPLSQTLRLERFPTKELDSRVWKLVFLLFPLHPQCPWRRRKMEATRGLQTLTYREITVFLKEHWPLLAFYSENTSFVKF